jgi:hypothetical protein
MARGRLYATIEELYQFTDVRNLPLIRDYGGLWSLAQLEDTLGEVSTRSKSESIRVTALFIRRIATWTASHQTAV